MLMGSLRSNIPNHENVMDFEIRRPQRWNAFRSGFPSEQKHLLFMRAGQHERRLFFSFRNSFQNSLQHPFQKPIPKFTQWMLGLREMRSHPFQRQLTSGSLSQWCCLSRASHGSSFTSGHQHHNVAELWDMSPGDHL